MPTTHLSLPKMEPLPPRLLLSVTLENGILTVRGTPGDDYIFIGGTWNSSGNMVELIVTVNHQPSPRFGPSQIKSMRVLALGGNDQIIDESNPDFGVTISGGAGNDHIEAQGSGQVIQGVGGADIRDSSQPLHSIDDGPGRDTVIANNGRDILSGKAWMHVRANGTAVVHGSDRNDVIAFGAAPYIVCTPETIDCGEEFGHYEPGTDLSINGVSAWLPLGTIKRIVAHLGKGNDSLSLGSDHNKHGLITMILGAEIPATIFGGQGNDTIIGGSLADSILGGGGDDSILAGGGNDVVQGGDGDDFIDGDNDADLIRAGAGRDTITGEVGDDTIYGDSSDEIDGGGGRDVVKRKPSKPAETKPIWGIMSAV